MRHAFEKTVTYFCVPNAMMFTSKPHLCQGTEFYNVKVQTKLSNTVTFILLVTSSSHFGNREPCFETGTKD